MNDYGKGLCTGSRDCDTVNYSFPGIQKPLEQYGPASVADSSPAKDAEDADEDDDDFDLFGSDDEEAVCVMFVWVVRH